MSDLNRRQFLSYAAALPLALCLPINSQASTHSKSSYAKSERLSGMIHEIEGDIYINKNVANQSAPFNRGTGSV